MNFRTVVKIFNFYRLVVMIIYMILGCGNDAQFQDFCRFINKPQLAESDEYKTNEDRVRNRAELITVSIEIF